MEVKEIFDKSAHKYMLQWNIQAFKKSHPRLYKAIIDAMESCASPPDIEHQKLDKYSDGYGHRLQDGKSESQSLKKIQLQLPWTVKYSREFRANPQKHKDFAHGLLHTTKACGKIAGYIDDLDHRMESDMDSEALENYIADLVICAMRMANTGINGRFDLQKAVVRRLETKNEVKLNG